MEISLGIQRAIPDACPCEVVFADRTHMVKWVRILFNNQFTPDEVNDTTCLASNPGPVAISSASMPQVFWEMRRYMKS